MSRIELLEMLVAQMEENEQLREENERLKEQMNGRQLICQRSGTLAEASLMLTRIFEEADRAIEIYRSNLGCEPIAAAAKMNESGEIADDPDSGYMLQNKDSENASKKDTEQEKKD